MPNPGILEELNNVATKGQSTVMPAVTACPRCRATTGLTKIDLSEDPGPNDNYIPVTEFEAGTCAVCRDLSLWVQGRRVFPPDTIAGPEPNSALSNTATAAFEEARAVFEQSPRAAAGLLRLVVHDLLCQLGQPGRDINQEIGVLAAQGVPDHVHKALDVLRILGNQSVHNLDAEIDLDLVLQCFEFVNLVADAQIGLPQRVNDAYEAIPETKRLAIEARNSGQ